MLNIVDDATGLQKIVQVEMIHKRVCGMDSGIKGQFGSTNAIGHIGLLAKIFCDKDCKGPGKGHQDINRKPLLTWYMRGGRQYMEHDV